jgi:hypothetical protein
MKANKNNILHKDTLCGEEEPDCGHCPDEPCHCPFGFEEMLEKADMMYELARDKEIGI